MNGSIIFFIEKRIPEADLLALFNEELLAGVESLEYPNEVAAVFLQHLDYDVDFQQSAMLSWAAQGVAIDDIGLAQSLAARFSTKIILEPQNMSLPDGYDWCLVTEERQLYAVAVAELDDGLALRPDAPSVPLNS